MILFHSLQVFLRLGVQGFNASVIFALIFSHFLRISILMGLMSLLPRWLFADIVLFTHNFFLGDHPTSVQAYLARKDASFHVFLQCFQFDFNPSLHVLHTFLWSLPSSCEEQLPRSGREGGRFMDLTHHYTPSTLMTIGVPRCLLRTVDNSTREGG